MTTGPAQGSCSVTGYVERKGGKGKGPGLPGPDAAWATVLEDSEGNWGQWTSSGKGSHDQEWHAAEWGEARAWVKGSWSQQDQDQREAETGLGGPAALLTMTPEEQRAYWIKYMRPTGPLPFKIRIGPARNKYVYQLNQQDHEGGEAGDVPKHVKDP